MMDDFNAGLAAGFHALWSAGIATCWAVWLIDMIRSVVTTAAWDKGDGLIDMAALLNSRLALLAYAMALVFVGRLA